MQEACKNCKSFDGSHCRLGPTPKAIQNPQTHRCGGYKNIGLSTGPTFARTEPNKMNEGNKGGKTLFLG